MKHMISHKKYPALVNRMFTPWMFLLCAVGMLLNIALIKLVAYFSLPLYLDNVDFMAIYRQEIERRMKTQAQA